MLFRIPIRVEALVVRDFTVHTSEQCGPIRRDAIMLVDIDVAVRTQFREACAP